ncbi:MAG: GNAT family N-acetyltransferase [Candidatus Bathyarchaeota archaeon]|nr:GNAT family N-acetyltransferase [Candidatus Bathyarchaeota archaeon]
MGKSENGELCIFYVSGNESLLDDVEPLWTSLNSMLLGCSANFKQHYRNMTFQNRKRYLQKKAAAGKMRVTLAVDDTTSQRVGYCVSSLDAEKTGEIESIFVASAYRGKGVGDALMKDALAWMSAEGAEKRVVAFSAGNEQVFGFYLRHGFYPRKTVLEQV